MSRIDQPRMISALRRYFASGWAFLIPYLAIYLLYYVTEWPVNPESDADARDIPASAMPSLLHVYWALHAMHLALGAMALWSRPNANSDERKLSWEEGAKRIGSRIHTLREFLVRRCPLHSSQFTLRSSILFWVLLALIFYIPGVYLEWPSDPWEHLRRINEWHGIATVGAHSCWYKSAYFIPYSMLSWATGLRQLFWLDFYYTGICLLLCWQYYRLSRACGLGDGASKLFVLIQAILFGNNIFSFYRYYGISSSIYAQIGAVAITRVVLEFAARGRSTQRDNGFPLSPPHEQPFWHWPTLCRSTLPAIACLVPFVALNHEQGIGIAALGVLAIVIWRIIEWKRTALWGLIAGTLVVNALFLWLYPRPEVVETYRNSGWLNAWYGFNIFDFSHPAGDRMLQIVSAFGLVNILAALLLLRRNHVSAWLTITPLIALSLPCISIPLAIALSGNGDRLSYIITFQRFLFTIPTGLAFIRTAHQGIIRAHRQSHQYAHAIACAIAATLVAPPPEKPSYNRLWNAISTQPNDLRIKDVSNEASMLQERNRMHRNERLITNKTGVGILSFYPIGLIAPDSIRGIAAPASDEVRIALDTLNFDERTEEIFRSAGEHNTKKEIDNLLSDPYARNPAAWIALSGPPPTPLNSSANEPTAIGNVKGYSAHVFTSELTPIYAEETYRLEISIRQLDKTRATAFLAVAWYDENGRLLPATPPPPSGAGSPRGWSNGWYSYFGLIAQSPKTDWTKHSITFGLRTAIRIPRNAHFIRVGALLNHNATPEAEIFITNVKLTKTEEPGPTLIAFPPLYNYSHKSLAGQLSTHWLPQEVALDHTGAQEIQIAANKSTAARSNAQPTRQP